MSKQIYFDAMKEKGKLDATDLQTRSAGMTGTELYAEDGKIPSFAAAVARKNMLERKVGFVCRSTAGRVVKLLQNYDSTVYPPGAGGSAGAVGLPVVHGSEKGAAFHRSEHVSLRQG